MTDLGILGEIARRKRSDITRRLEGQRLEELRHAAEPTRRSLSKTLSAPGARFIFEVKRASPSAGAIRPAVDAAAIARCYRPVADAISVLTDEPYFGGSLHDLELVRREFDGPILAKDFIIDPRQVIEARMHGADAVLVILALLDDHDAGAAMAEARRLSMDVIVEVHDERELGRAIRLDPEIIGINNRNLKTLAIDLGTAERLAPLVPPHILAIAESGIRSRADVERLAPKVDAFLVGSSLMASPNVGEAARALVHGRVKVCGLTLTDDIELVSRAGATHAGLVLVPESPRAVRLAEAQELAIVARSLGLKTVGVFRNAPVPEVVYTADQLGLDVIQLHGGETESEIREIRRALPVATELWAVCGVNGSVASARPGADRSLFDTVRNGSSGGTGYSFDWSLLHGRSDLASAFLAGGIAPANAREASRVGAYGLDVGSGIEFSPGLKDQSKVEALFASLRPTSRGQA